MVHHQVFLRREPIKMTIKYLVAFCLIFSTIQQGDGRKCYSCGYRRNGDQQSEELPDVDFCADFSNPEDHLADCPDENECCASLKEYITKEDEETGDNTTITIGRHGCESELGHLTEFNAICSEHKNECYHVEQASLGNHQHENVTVFDVEVCFCDSDRCNTEDPIPPVDPPTTTPAASTGPSKTCYACGYLARWVDGSIGIIEEIDGVPFCKDKPSMESFTKQCGNGDDCCGSVKEYRTREVDGKQEMFMIARHDCEFDLASLGNQGIICNKDTYGCFNVSTENIANQDDLFLEACFCEGDRCNNEIPNLPPPDGTTTTRTTTTQGGSDDHTTTQNNAAFSLVSSLLTVLVSLSLLSK